MTQEKKKKEYKTPEVKKKGEKKNAMLTLFSAQTSKGDKLWFQDFLFEEANYRAVVKGDCSAMLIIKYTDKTKSEEVERTSLTDFESRQGSSLNQEGVEEEYSFFVANFPDFKFSTFLEESNYYDETKPGSCPYYLKVSYNENAMAKPVIDIDDVF